MDKSAVVRATAHGIMCLDINFLHFMTLPRTRQSSSSSFVFDVNWRRKRNGRKRNDAVHASSSLVSSSSSSADDQEHRHHHQREQRGFRGKNTVTTALSDKNKVDVFVFIDCDNVRPRFSASDEDAAAQRFLHAFHRAASCYGDVVSLSLYGNEKTFGEEVQGDVKRGGEEDEGEGEEGGWTRARTNERNTKKKSLGEALESVRILGSRVRVVRTQSRRKQSADIRCVSDVVDAMRKSADNETTTTTEKLRLAFIVSKDAGLLKEAASPYVRKRGDVVICGDFINNVGMREIDSHPIEDAYREVVEKKIGWSSGVKIKGKPGSEALAIGSRLVSWKDESVWFYAKSDEDVEKRRRKSNAPRKAARKRREDPYLFMIPGPSSSEKEMEEKEMDERFYQNCVRYLPSSIQTEMRDIIDAYCRRRRRNVDTAANENNNTVFLSKLLRREAKRKLLPVRSNACFASASDVLVYFDAGPKLGAVFGKWLENGDLEMLW